MIRLTLWKTLRIPLFGDPWIHRFFPSEIGTFLLGSLGYHFYAHARNHRWNLKPAGWAAWATTLAAIFFLQSTKNLTHLPPATFTLIVGLSVPFIFALDEKLESGSLDRHDFQYPVYIVHVVVRGSRFARGP